MAIVYDPTAGMIETPGGMGKFVEYDGNCGVVTVEMDNGCLFFYPAELCYVDTNYKNRH